MPSQSFEDDALKQQEATAEEELLKAQEAADELMAKAVTKYRGRRLGDGDRPAKRRIMLEEVKDGVMTLTPFDPEDVLHEVTVSLKQDPNDDEVIKYTVQDMLDEVGKVTEEPRFRTSAEYFADREALKEWKTPQERD